MQAVRQFLLSGPVQIEGQDYESLAEYYTALLTPLQRGHAASVKGVTVEDMLTVPEVWFNGMTLTHASVLVCDIVHNALLDYLRYVKKKDGEPSTSRSGKKPDLPKKGHAMRPYFDTACHEEYPHLKGFKDDKDLRKAALKYYKATHDFPAEKDQPPVMKPFWALQPKDIVAGVEPLEFYWRKPPVVTCDPNPNPDPKGGKRRQHVAPDEDDDEHAEPENSGDTLTADGTHDADEDDTGKENGASGPGSKRKRGGGTAAKNGTSKKSKPAVRAGEPETRAGSVSDRMRNAGPRCIRLAHMVMGNAGTVGSKAPKEAQKKYYAMLDRFAVWEMTLTRHWLGGDQYSNAGSKQYERNFAHPLHMQCIV